MGDVVARTPFGRLRGWVAWLFVLGGFATLCGGQTPGVHLRTASAIAFDGAGNLLIADSKGHQVLKATLGGSLLVVAGTGTQGFAGDGGPATAAQLNQPEGLAVGPDGTLYIADTGNQRVRAVSKDGVITTVAGSGQVGFAGDGGPATVAVLSRPVGLAVDGSGALLLCDSGNHRVRRVVQGVISTVAGTGAQGYSGDGGPALAAELDTPTGLALDGSGRIYLADTHNHRVRVVDSSGVITTFAGTGISGFAGDGGPANKAQLRLPRGVAVDAAGELLIADTGNERIREVSAAGVISTVSGFGVEGASADGDPGPSAPAQGPLAVAFSSFGARTFADTGSGTVRELWDQAQVYRPAALADGRTTTLQLPGPITVDYGQTSVEASVVGAVGVTRGGLEATEDSERVASAALSDGSALLNMPSLSAGVHTLTVRFAGDGLNPAATGTVQATVRAAPVLASADAVSMVYGAAIPALTGVLSGVLPQDSSAVSAAFAVPGGDLPGVGTYPIRAALQGAKAGNYTVAMAAGSGELRVTQAPTTVVVGSVPQGFVGLPVTLTATVRSSTRGLPTGTVQFLDGGQVVAAGVLQAGTASAVYAAPPAGVRTLRLQYSGDANFLPSASVASALPVSPLPDFGIAASGPSSITASAGGVATFTLLVAAQPGPFTGAVSLSVSGLPTSAVASFSPPQVVPGSGSAVVAMRIQTGATVLSRTGGSRTRGSDGPGGSVGFAFLVVSMLGWRRRRWRLSLLFLVPVTGLLIGCGARTVSEGSGGAVAQTYTLQVTATGTNLAGAVVTHTIPLTLTVDQ